MLTRDEFAKLLNTKFDVEAADGRQAGLVLEEVSELKQLKGSEHFSLLFRGPHEVPFAQGICQFNLEGSENMELFIVPVAREEKGYLYESVFNMLRDAENSTANASQ